MSKCPACNRRLPVSVAGNVRCVCGHRFLASGDAITATPTKQLPCVHLGEQVGTADCDCQSKPRVYACGLHGLCMPRMSVTASAVAMDDGSRATVSRSCAKCEDHQPAWLLAASLPSTNVITTADSGPVGQE